MSAISRFSRLAGAVILLARLSSGLSADTVVMSDGTRLEGTIEIETPQKVVLKQGTENKIIERSDIASIVKRDGSTEGPAAPVRAAPSRASAPRSAKAPLAPANVQNDPAAGIVVKVTATIVAPDLLKPWTRLPPRVAVGSGWLIGSGRVMTNAHLVMYSNEVQIQANESGDKISASVVAVAPDLDLAVLKLDEKSALDNPVGLANSGVLPDIKDSVSVYGFPDEGSNLSISTGTISRIDFAQPGRRFVGLHLWLNTPFNAGLSGGPVVFGNLVVGVADNISNGDRSQSFIIPVEETNRFLMGLAADGYKGKPLIVQDFQRIGNPSLRSFLNLQPSLHGMLVGEADRTSGISPFRDWDVVTQIGGAPVDDEGMIPFGNGRRISYPYMVEKAVANGSVPFKVLRSGQEIAVNVPVVSKPPTVFRDLGTSYPSFFILGPVVFSTATKQILSVIDGFQNIQALQSYRASPLITRLADSQAFAGEELVVIASPFFPHKLAEGYSDPSLCVVKTVNGIAVKNLLHLVQVLRDSKDEFIVIEFWDKYSEGLVFPRSEMIAATESILNDNDVRSQGSADTMAVWKGKLAH